MEPDKIEWPSLLIAIPSHQGKLLMENVPELLLLQNAAMELKLDIGFTYLSGCSLVDVVRNSLAHNFRQSDYQKVLMIDDDVIFTHRDVLQLLYWSIRHPVVCATYPSRVELASAQDRFYVRPLSVPPTFTEEGLMKVRGVGAGFLIVDRSVFDTLQPKVESYTGGNVRKGVMEPRALHYNFFPIGVRDGEHHGEDHGFFDLCVTNGYEPVLDYHINLKHVGTKAFDAHPREALKQLGWLPQTN